MPTIVIKTPKELAAQDRRAAAARKLVYSPLTVTQALVVRALVPPQRSLVITPPSSGTVRLPYKALTVKYQTFNKLRELGALTLDEIETAGSPRQVYRLSKQGHALWEEHCRIEGVPTRDPSID